ncbi:MAG: hypothetical protein GY866_08555 [Proteobacteria bacterium]|nr:hypothetical protein [Pseudomonadota bacterium]
METQFQPYYCYVNDGNPVVLETEPAGFHQLPGRYSLFCPNLTIAKMTYPANLRIMEWRAEEAEEEEVYN